MEAKLQALKVADLKALLTSAGLAVSGNKPDLIQRLLENPSATASLGEATETPAPAAPAAAVSTPTPAPAAAPSPTPAPAAPAAPAATEQAASTGPSEEARRQTLIVELEKRRARAAKFGTTLGEAERKLERAIKFGLDPEDEANVAKLTQPLGTKPAKGEGRKDAKKDEVKESEEEKQARLKRVEEEKEKARKRAERFGLSTAEGDGEGKRKRGENGEGGEKKVKT